MEYTRRSLEGYGEAKRECDLLRAQLACGEVPEEEKVRIRQRLILAEEKCRILRREAEKVIRAVPNRRHVREILRLRYICLMKWDKIAECMMLEKRWVMRLHKWGMDWFRRNPDSDE